MGATISLGVLGVMLGRVQSARGRIDATRGELASVVAQSETHLSAGRTRLNADLAAKTPTEADQEDWVESLRGVIDRSRAAESIAAHVGDIEQSGTPTRRKVFGDGAGFVLDRHLPSGEVDDGAPVILMPVEQGRAAWFSGRSTHDDEGTSSSRPLPRSEALAEAATTRAPAIGSGRFRDDDRFGSTR